MNPIPAKTSQTATIATGNKIINVYKSSGNRYTVIHKSRV